MSLPLSVERCPGVDWDPFGVQPDCLDCIRRKQGIADYVGGVKGVVWLEPSYDGRKPCPDRLAAKREKRNG